MEYLKKVKLNKWRVSVSTNTPMMENITLHSYFDTREDACLYLYELTKKEEYGSYFTKVKIKYVKIKRLVKVEE